jgi:glycosyltransferase involved in cell wall biosynthesis
LDHDDQVSLRLLVVAPSALLTDHRPHGDGLVAFGFIQELSRRGHDLHVAAGIVDLREEPPPNVHVHRLARGGDNPVATRLGFMRRLHGLYRRLSSESPFDIVHQLTPVEIGVTIGLAGARTPLVLGPYVPDWLPSHDPATQQKRATRTVRRGLRAAQQLTATTVLLSNPAAEEKVSVLAGRGLHLHELPLGVDAQTWRPAEHSRPNQDLLFLANLDSRKGVHVALDAFVRLSPELPGARLLIAGGGPERDLVERRMSSTPSLERVELLGQLDRTAAVAAMQGCALYCLPAYGDANPLTVLEAMSCGKPVVATAAGGLGHVVSDSGGRKVPVGDADALAAALRELLTDPELRRAMGAHNRRLVDRQYAWPRVIDRLEELYDEAMRAPRTHYLRANRGKRDV